MKTLIYLIAAAVLSFIGSWIYESLENKELVRPYRMDDGIDLDVKFVIFIKTSIVVLILGSIFVILIEKIC